MNGVSRPVASAGSNHDGASATATAHVSWPSAGAAGADTGATRRATSTSEASRGRRVMATSLLPRQGRRLDPEKAEAVVPGDVLVDVRRQPQRAQRLVHRLL